MFDGALARVRILECDGHKWELWLVFVRLAVSHLHHRIQCTSIGSDFRLTRPPAENVVERSENSPTVNSVSAASHRTL